MKPRYLTQESLLADIKSELPRLIFLTGKTSTGKTTLSNLIGGFGYEVITLDSVVQESVIKKFHVEKEEEAFPVYHNNVPKEWADSFVEAARAQIRFSVEKGPVLIEGSLADNELIKRIFCDAFEEFTFIFLLPINIPLYAHRIQKRFMKGIKTNTTGLPKQFFEMVTPTEIETFLQTEKVNTSLAKQLKAFATESAEESKRRLAYFKESNPSISVLEI